MLAPKYPIYIVSKGRADTRLTSRTLEEMRVPYYVVVEEQERDEYAAVIDPRKVLVLDRRYQGEYDACVELPEGASRGSGPARNFAWDHALSLGAYRHWVMDDNINGFYRFNRNLKVPAKTGAIFRAMEDFSDRYSNVLLSGPNYFMFVSRKSKAPPFVANTRIYSCILIRNDAPFRWRCRYNEDTDLSLRVLKAGYCTVLFNAFLQMKATTQTMRGGNTDAFYAAEGTGPKTEALIRLHPDVTCAVTRWGRIHHYVDYSPFKNNALRRSAGALPSTPDEYGMELVDRGPRP